MNYNFDEIIDRKNTNSIKYDFATERGRPEGVIPLWVADMDFRIAPEIIDVLVEKSTHGIFGYTDTKDDYFDAIYQWFSTRFDWQPKKEWLVKAPGVVFSLALSIRAFTEEGDSVLIQQPVYSPFSQVVLSNNRNLVVNSLKLENKQYEIDFEDFEHKIIKEKVKLFVLCSPHNPVGRVWTKEELTRLGDICLKHNVLVISDEVHCDFTYSDNKHLVFPSIREDFEEISILCTAPSKTFNLAGLQTSNLFISNKELKRKFTKELSRSGYSQLNTMGLAACQAAYTHGSLWLDELKDYLLENLNFVRTFLEENLPEVKLIEPQGTYLLWLDFNKLDLNQDELNHLITHKANLWLNDGPSFGEGGKGFFRMNIACQKSILESALKNLESALKNRF